MMPTCTVWVFFSDFNNYFLASINLVAFALIPYCYDVCIFKNFWVIFGPTWLLQKKRNEMRPSIDHNAPS